MLTAQTDVGGHLLLESMADARRRSDALFDIVRPDAIYDRPIPERHRIIFYVGHLEAFDWNLLHENVFGLKSFHPEFDRLFAFGIDPVGGGLPTDQPSDWPSLNRCVNTCARSERRWMKNYRPPLSMAHAHARRLSARYSAQCRDRASLDASSKRWPTCCISCRWTGNSATRASSSLLPNLLITRMIRDPCRNGNSWAFRGTAKTSAGTTNSSLIPPMCPHFEIDQYMVTNRAVP